MPPQKKKKKKKDPAPNFLPRVPMRLTPASHILMPPNPKKSIMWPLPRKQRLRGPRVQLGAEVMCRMEPAPALLVKAAAQRVVSDILCGCTPPPAGAVQLSCVRERTLP